MGINSSKSISYVMTKIDQELLKLIDITPTTYCGYNAGRIKLINAKRCAIAELNRCGITPSAALEAISSGAALAYMQADMDLKKKLLPGFDFNNTLLNTKNEIKFRLTQFCEENSEYTHNYALHDTNIYDCEDAIINNINTGSSQANCAMKYIIDVILNAQYQGPKPILKYTLGDLLGLGNNFGLTNFSSSCCCLTCIFIFVILLLLYLIRLTQGVNVNKKINS